MRTVLLTAIQVNFILQKVKSVERALLSGRPLFDSVRELTNVTYTRTMIATWDPTEVYALRNCD